MTQDSEIKKGTGVNGMNLSATCLLAAEKHS